MDEEVTQVFGVSESDALQLLQVVQVVLDVGLVVRVLLHSQVVRPGVAAIL